ncbi:hypothetical protein [uncultured Desulfosarcina sp.]|uniref:hypothetical protein n=1 Tax=uncultured Desulfosarcina sp. TaxID=218289 RepID=UPI0029C7FA7B|nr:hypothetical protein [uncultured Desulfosarcina sp.]
MERHNLEINILYFMCNPLNGQLQDGTVNRTSATGVIYRAQCVRRREKTKDEHI